jgi:preprotein translocase subunit YajC
MFTLANIFVGTAWADAAGTVANVSGTATAAAPVASVGSDLMGPQAIVFGIILVIFYFLMIRPQQQKIEQHNALLKKLQRGDQIVTAGGIHGTIHKMDGDDHVMVEIADGVRVKIVRSTITDLVKKPQTAVATDKKS